MSILSTRDLASGPLAFQGPGPSLSAEVLEPVAAMGVWAATLETLEWGSHGLPNQLLPALGQPLSWREKDGQ